MEHETARLGLGRVVERVGVGGLGQLVDSGFVEEVLVDVRDVGPGSAAVEGAHSKRGICR